MCLSAKAGDRCSPLRHGTFPKLSEKQARSARSAILHESKDNTAAIRYCHRVITSLRHYAVMPCHHQAHVGHCITVFPGVLTMALIRVQAGDSEVWICRTRALLRRSKLSILDELARFAPEFVAQYRA
jgi:hypothetical protein